MKTDIISKMVSPKGGFFIFDTHPIQYRSPVFAALARKYPKCCVYYFDEHFDGNKWWFHETAKTPKQKLGIPLRKGFPNEVLQSGQLGLWGFYRKIRKLLSVEKPSAVALYGYYLPQHWVVLWQAHRLGIPVLFVGETFFSGKSWVRRMIKRILRPLFFNRISRFITIGDKTRSFYRSLHIEEERVKRAKYCVDTSFFSLDAESARTTRARVRKQLNIPDEAFVLLFVGRLFDRKRPFDVLEAHKKVAEKNELHTVFVGSGELELPLMDRAFNEDQIHFVGFKGQREIRDYYYLADLLFVPSEYETWGLVVNEAFACGLPALVTEDCGVAKDLVLSGETGYIYPTGKVSVAAVVVNYLIEHRDELKLMGRKAKKKVSSQYSVDQFADAMLGALSEVTSLRGGAQA